MNLSERFYQYLEDNQITEFITSEALNWYESQRKPGLKPATHSDLSFLILKPLLYQKKIKRIFTGCYLVRSSSELLSNQSKLNQSKSNQLETISEAEIQTKFEENEEDKEFFKYLESKSKRLD